MILEGTRTLWGTGSNVSKSPLSVPTRVNHAHRLVLYQRLSQMREVIVLLLSLGLTEAAMRHSGPTRWGSARAAQVSSPSDSPTVSESASPSGSDSSSASNRVAFPTVGVSTPASISESPTPSESESVWYSIPVIAVDPTLGSGLNAPLGPPSSSEQGGIGLAGVAGILAGGSLITCCLVGGAVAWAIRRWPPPGAGSLQKSDGHTANGRTQELTTQPAYSRVNPTADAEESPSHFGNQLEDNNQGAESATLYMGTGRLPAINEIPKFDAGYSLAQYSSVMSEQTNAGAGMAEKGAPLGDTNFHPPARDPVAFQFPSPSPNTVVTVVQKPTFTASAAEGMCQMFGSRSCQNASCVRHVSVRYQCPS